MRLDELCVQTRREGEKGGKGGPPSLKNTENGVPARWLLSDLKYA